MTEGTQLSCQSAYVAWLEEARSNPDVARAFRLLADAVIENHRAKLRLQAEEAVSE